MIQLTEEEDEQADGRKKSLEIDRKKKFVGKYAIVCVCINKEEEKKLELGGI